MPSQAEPPTPTSPAILYTYDTITRIMLLLNDDTMRRATLYLPHTRRQPQDLAKAFSKEPPASSSEPESPDLEAIRAAEKKEALLRAARLRRTEQLREEASEEQKKEQAKKEYDNRYNTAARKYRLFIIAMPILLVTSYMLFVRILRGNDPNGKPITQKKEEEQQTGS
ncbi:hypothetical protein NM208_g15888 [Fusarium decemcellulare]|uniref:Uncharacterized protein n=1 Tax=Fusarium decemcellulare TaxID=57161 RepID=A0ACC1RBT1_9HYPO|nr:hypothetical protein NM208_g15888 [Fusarium decemcellulare]